MCSRNKVLIFGLGSDILTDDGIGSTVVHQLQQESLLNHCDFKTALLFNLDLVKEFESYELIIIIDATLSKTKSTGEISINHMSDFKDTLHLSNIHETSFINMVDFWKKLGFKIPDDIYVISIVIKEFSVFSDSMSEEIQRKYNQIFQTVLDWIKSKSSALSH